MEEYVGGLWHRFITRLAERDFPHAAVRLEEIEATAGILFRAFGGDSGLRVTAAADASHGARRRLMQKIAGSGERTAHASVDEETLRLPPTLALFPQRALNRDLYLWLIALAGAHTAAGESAVAAGWLDANRRATASTLARYPGLAARYRRLAEAHIGQRPDPARLPADEAALERAIRTALAQPDAEVAQPVARHAPQPVPLWLYPSPAHLPAGGDDGPAVPEEADEGAGDAGPEARKRYRAERSGPEDKDAPFMLQFRGESLLSWAEYVKVNRADDDDPESNAAVADDMDQLSVTRGGKAPASKVRFDLDLPSPAQDDLPLGEGLTLPEWDWKKRTLRRDFVRVQPMVARDASAMPLPDHLRRAARRLRGQFSALLPQRHWLKAQPDGSEPDMDAWVRRHTDRAAGLSGQRDALYLAQVRQLRDLACLVLADLSLSTDAWISDRHRVIDVIRDSLSLFSEALAATGDAFGLYGFSSLKRNHVRFHSIKEFGDRYDADVRGRIAALKPGYYTRMGAAIRMAARVLEEQPNALRLLLILTDGKPHDMDHYEGRYAIEDTRKAVLEAREAGLKPFCVTIDREGAGYLPHVFGRDGFIVVRDPAELPRRLPMLYAQLTSA